MERESEGRKTICETEQGEGGRRKLVLEGRQEERGCEKEGGGREMSTLGAMIAVGKACTHTTPDLWGTEVADYDCHSQRITTGLIIHP
ncbi:hypothetical protein Pcinc_007807 [Petrolisthes cinctipes]|uniref:Uncharacterized protein n=1 Tax=Petrolisthes cinctipes TaxID=88211 RepID=A0AAE1GA97_PETCI|nr:hypothetical protein Pcinc_007807 [Petrolisthes cinctipes]